MRKNEKKVHEKKRKQKIIGFKPDVIVHSAAERRLDRALANKER